MTAEHRVRDDGGLSLIELIVAVVVSGILIVSVGVIFINSWRTQENVLSVSEATNRGQIVGSAIEKAVRNGKELKPVADNTLYVWTSVTPVCQAFTLNEGGALNVVRSVSTDGSTELPLATAVSAWSVWEPELELRLGSKITDDAGTVSYQLLIETTSAPVRIEGDVSQRSKAASEEDNPCW